jgi:hypothetical protein
VGLASARNLYGGADGGGAEYWSSAAKTSRRNAVGSGRSFSRAGRLFGGCRMGIGGRFFPCSDDLVSRVPLGACVVLTWSTLRSQADIGDVAIGTAFLLVGSAFLLTGGGFLLDGSTVVGIGLLLLGIGFCSAGSGHSSING